MEKTEQKKSRKRKISLKILEKKARSLVGLISKKADVAFEGLVKVSAPFFAKINITIEQKKLKEYSEYALLTLFGFLMSIARFPQQVRPLGIAAICSFSHKQKVLFTYIGTALGCLTYMRSGMTAFIVYFMLYLARKAFTDSKFSEKLTTRVVESAVASMVIGIVGIIEEQYSPLYAYIAFFCLTCIAGAFTCFFTILFSQKEYGSVKTSTISICSYALMAAIVCSLDNIAVFGFDVQLVASCVITLSYAAVNGFLHAGIVGFVCGIACQSPIASACLGICAVVSSVLLSKSIIAATVSFVMTFFITASYGAGLAYSAILLPSVMCGCILFFPICGMLPDALRLNARATKVSDFSTGRNYNSKNTKKLSDALFSLSDIFTKLAEKQKYPSYTDVEYALERTLSTVCAGCALCEMCYAKNKTDMEELKKNLCLVLQTRAVSDEDFGKNMSEKCIRLERHCDELNRIYREIAVTKASDNRTALMGTQYAGLARLLIDSQSNSYKAMQRDEAFEKNIMKALQDADIPFTYVRATSTREKKVSIGGINLDRISLGTADLCKYIFAKTGIRVTEPAFDLSEKNDIVMSFERAPVIFAEYAQKCVSKGSESVNGDTVNFVYSDDNYFRAYICDGMGSGPEAAASSRLASLFLEKMLSTGVKKSVILELLNNALMSRSPESFSTVDLFESDLLTGNCTFIKAGAAPTYVLRQGEVYKIFSATPPVGIISGFTAESTKFDVVPDDVVIMMSDGVVGSNEDAPWLAELIKMDLTSSPCVLAQNIIEKAAGLNNRSDDMSVCVVKIKGR